MFDIPTPKIPFPETLKQHWEIGYSVPQVRRAIFDPTRHKLPSAAMALQFAGDPNPSHSLSFDPSYAAGPVQTELPEHQHADALMTGNIIDILFCTTGATFFFSLFLDLRALKIRHRLVRLAQSLEGDLSTRTYLLPPMPNPSDELLDSGEITMDQNYISAANTIIDEMIERAT
jgi:hypothetical protein